MIIFLFGVVLVRVNAVNLLKLTKNEPMFSVVLLLVISVLVGTVVSLTPQPVSAQTRSPRH